jgi:hypothetical protein
MNAFKKVQKKLLPAHAPKITGLDLEALYDSGA